MKGTLLSREQLPAILPAGTDLLPLIIPIHVGTGYLRVELKHNCYVARRSDGGLIICATGSDAHKTLVSVDSKGCDHWCFPGFTLIGDWTQWNMVGLS